VPGEAVARACNVEHASVTSGLDLLSESTERAYPGAG
jgi:hypothetical protein